MQANAHGDAKVITDGKGSIGTRCYCMEPVLEDNGAAKIREDAGKGEARNDESPSPLQTVFLPSEPNQTILGTVSRRPDSGLAFPR